MLVLSRKVGDSIQIGDSITIRVSRISGSRVTLGVEAPESVRIVRGELKRIVEDFESHEEKTTTNQATNQTTGKAVSSDIGKSRGNMQRVRPSVPAKPTNKITPGHRLSRFQSSTMAAK